MNTYRVIWRFAHQGEYWKIGEMGILLETFDRLGIPWDISAAGNPPERGGDIFAWYISIPPNRDEHQVVLFCFDRYFQYAGSTLENAHPMGYAHMEPWEDETYSTTEED